MPVVQLILFKRTYNRFKDRKRKTKPSEKASGNSENRDESVGNERVRANVIALNESFIYK